LKLQLGWRCFELILKRNHCWRKYRGELEKRERGGGGGEEDFAIKKGE
jgi:hypothetical protein